MRARGRSAFTLLEIMTVLLIIGLLVGFFAVQGQRILAGADVQTTRNRLATLQNLLESYRAREGDYPDDRLPEGIAGNGVNDPAEALFLAFFAPEYQGQAPNQDWLVNTDGDATSRSLTRLPERELFEIGDRWGNPIVYFDFRHYAQAEATVHAGPEDGAPAEQHVRPRRNPRTGLWYEEGRFQLLSAGEDGQFGTDDDLANFKE